MCLHILLSLFVNLTSQSTSHLHLQIPFLQSRARHTKHGWLQFWVVSMGADKYMSDMLHNQYDPDLIGKTGMQLLGAH